MSSRVRLLADDAVVGSFCFRSHWGHGAAMAVSVSQLRGLILNTYGNLGSRGTMYVGICFAQRLRRRRNSEKVSSCFVSAHSPCMSKSWHRVSECSPVWDATNPSTTAHRTTLIRNTVELLTIYRTPSPTSRSLALKAVRCV
jgi:hypothetical protein